jgi:hypothetical protein
VKALCPKHREKWTIIRTEFPNDRLVADPLEP